ncbi:MAG: hypothetical protein ABR577_10350 [Pyrinomonadaceae bacterium]
MRKSVGIIALVAFGCFFWLSCGASNFVNCIEGSGKIVSENRTVDSFDSVKFSCASC